MDDETGIDDHALPPGTRRLVIPHYDIDEIEGILADADALVAPYVDAMEPAGRDQLRLQVIGLLAGRQVTIIPAEQPRPSELLVGMPLPPGMVGGGRIQ